MNVITYKADNVRSIRKIVTRIPVRAAIIIYHHRSIGASTCFHLHCLQLRGEADEEAAG